MLRRCLSLLFLISFPAIALADDKNPAPGGTLQILDQQLQPLGGCPLKQTVVEADIDGFVARVTVQQVFENPLDRKIEAIYTFPLSADSAVDGMWMTVGERRIIGQIKPREDARVIYEAAKAAGHVASLLDQERPNIFTQSVANIEPGAQVTIEITYVETVKFEDGRFEWSFPTVVGPRYIPGQATEQAAAGTGFAPDTERVPDASRVTPPVVKPGFRTGHDIQLSVRIDTGSPGLPLANISSPLHEILVEQGGAQTAEVSLAKRAEIPNRDFVLRYQLATDDIGEGYFISRGPDGLYFTLLLQPPQRIDPQTLMPRELIFVLDTSGSMHGTPIEKAKDVMQRALDSMRPGDTFNLITFSGDTRILWDAPRPNTPKNRQAAQAFLAEQRGGGGTEMMKAIRAALEQQAPAGSFYGTADSRIPVLNPVELADLPADGQTVIVKVPYELWNEPEDGPYGGKLRLREDRVVQVIPTLNDAPFDAGSQISCPVGEPIFVRGTWTSVDGQAVFQPTAKTYTAPHAAPIRVCMFMTDGYVGNDFEIIDAVKKNAGTTRVFSFGIGNSVNRFLLDGMASAGRGEVEYVLLSDAADAAVKRFAERIAAPVLTDVRIDWGTLPVTEVYPRQIADLFAARPILVHGRLTEAAGGSVVLRGNTGAGPFERTISVRAPLLPALLDANGGSEPQIGGTAAAGRGASAKSLDPHVVLWARAKIAHLMMQDMQALQSGNFPAELKQEITQLGLTYGLMTQYTSFVAVEEMTVTVGGAPTTVAVPVEMPQGVSYEGVFGGGEARTQLMQTRGRKGSATGAAKGIAAPADSARPMAPPLPALRREAADDDRDAADEPATPQSKLDPALAGLAERVAQATKAGDLDEAGLSVREYRLLVTIRLSSNSEEALAALKKLGFEPAGESKTVPLLVGTIDVRKLDELAKLDVVVRIEPVRTR